MPDWHEMTIHERDNTLRQFLKEGENTFLAGGSIEDCPHRRESQKAIWWIRGFSNAMLGQQLASKS